MAGLNFAIGANTTAFESGMSRVRDLAVKRAGEMQSNFAGAAKGIDAAFGSLTALGKLPAQVEAAKAAALGLGIALAAAAAAYAFVTTAVGQANKELDRLVNLGEQAAASGFGVEFFAGFTEAAEKAKLSTEQIEAALKKASAAVTPKFEQDDPVKKQLNDLFESGYTGSYQSQGLADYNKAGNNEDRVRAAVTAMQELEQLGLRIAAIDLGEKLFGADVANNIRAGRLEIDAIAEGLERSSSGMADQVAKAAEYRDRLNEAWRELDGALGVSVNLAAEGQSILDGWLMIVQAMAAASKQMDGLLTKLGEAKKSSEDMMGSLANALGAGAINNYLFPNQGRTVATANDPQTTTVPIAPPQPPRRPLDFYTSTPKTSTPAAKSPATGSAETDPIKTFIDGLNKQSAALRAQVANFDKSTAQQQVAIQLARAQEVATANGKKLTDEQTASITAQATAYGNATDALTRLNAAQNRAGASARYFADTISDGLADAIVDGKSFGDILGSIEKQLARSAIQGLITGAGPFGNLFGLAGDPTAKGTDAAGGIFGTLLKSFGGLKFNAAGGPVQSGDWSVVGEQGPELVRFGRTGTVIPASPSSGGSQSAPAIQIINNRAQDVGVTPQRRPDGGTSLIIDQVDAALAQRVGSGRGDLAGVSPGARRLRG
jgi:hypothetical protein